MSSAVLCVGCACKHEARNLSQSDTKSWGVAGSAFRPAYLSLKKRSQAAIALGTKDCHQSSILSWCHLAEPILKEGFTLVQHDQACFCVTNALDP